MVDEARIVKKLAALERSVAKLRELAAMDREAFLDSYTFVDAAKYNLQTAVEAMIDTANHVISRRRLRMPRTNSESFEILSESGVIPAEKLQVLQAMARFRNRIVHMYDDVDDNQVYEILRNHLGDFDDFVEAITKNVLGRRS